MGPGVGLKAGLVFSNGSRTRLTMSYGTHWIETYSGADTDNIVTILRSALEFSATETISLGLGAGYYDRWSNVDIDTQRSYLGSGVHGVPTLDALRGKPRGNPRRGSLKVWLQFG
jgi:hypothetical protein